MSPVRAPARSGSVQRHARAPLDRRRLGPKSRGSPAALLAQSVAPLVRWTCPTRYQTVVVLSAIVMDTGPGERERDATDEHCRALRQIRERYRELAGEPPPSARSIGQRHPPLHPLRDPRLQMPRRPTPAPRPLLPVDRQDQQQNRHPRAQRDRGEAVPGKDRQRPQTTTPRRKMRQVAAKAAELRLNDHRPSPTTPHPNTHKHNQAATRDGPPGPPGSRNCRNRHRVLRPNPRFVQV